MRAPHLSRRSRRSAHMPGFARVSRRERSVTLDRFDIDGTQLTDLVASPNQFLASLSANRTAGLSVPDNVGVTVSRLDLRWHTGEWQPAADHEPTTRWSCYLIGGTVHCHRR